MKHIGLSVVLVVISLLGYTQEKLEQIGVYPNKVEIGGKKHVLAYYEYEVKSSVDELWAEVVGNYQFIGRVVKGIDSSFMVTEGVTGEGEVRQCNIHWKEQPENLKERITKISETDTRKEMTYEVFEPSFSSPIKSMVITWVVHKKEDGKTYLGQAMYVRASLPFLSRLVVSKMVEQGATKDAVLAYKHFLETGEANVETEKLYSLYHDE